MNPVNTIPLIPAAEATCYCFVVGEVSASLGVRPSNGNVVHGSLACGAHTFRDDGPKGLQRHINNPLRGLYVSTCHGCRRLCVDDCPLRRDHFDGPEASFVRGYVRVRHATYNVVDCRESDAVDSVHRTLDLFARPGKIKGNPSITNRKLDLDWNVRGVKAIVVEIVNGSGGSAGNLLDLSYHEA